jgi:hypothetical protein
MKQHTISLSSERFTLPPDEFDIELQSSKREKFLFEDSVTNRKVTPLSKPLVNYRNSARPIPNDFIMRITVDATCVTELRHLILGTCGDLVLYMKVKPVDHASKMKVWLCLSKSSVDTIISNILRVLPQAEFGKITPLLPA